MGNCMSPARRRKHVRHWNLKYTGFRLARGRILPRKKLPQPSRLTDWSADGAFRPDGLVPSAPAPSTESRTKHAERCAAMRANFVEADGAFPDGWAFQPVPGGTFEMGAALSTDDLTKMYGGSAEYYDREHPRHRVTLTTPFWMSTYEVTQAQWKELMPRNPSQHEGDQLPVHKVSWQDASRFITLLNERERAAGRVPKGWEYRLPTEAEWEYACRAGSPRSFCFGDEPGRLHEYGWFSRNSTRDPQQVGRKKANSWGLHDMHGNVFEWCQDGGRSYTAQPTTNPTGRVEGRRAVRGGCYFYPAYFCRASFRGWWPIDTRHMTVGFRLVLAPRTPNAPNAPNASTGNEAKRSKAGDDHRTSE